jgi:DtxR family Mn-dependent transcriptional regulator
MPLQQACIEGHQLEHAISPELEKCIEVTLKSPSSSPFGRPIPGSDHPTSKSERISLREATPDRAYNVYWIPEADTQLITFLVEHGVVPGAEITVVEMGEYRGVLVFRTDKGEGSLGYQSASQVMVLAS